MQIYTYVGDILLAINPYTPLPALYNKKQASTYQVVKPTTGPPHIFAIAQKVGGCFPWVFIVLAVCCVGEAAA